MPVFLAHRLHSLCNCGMNSAALVINFQHGTLSERSSVSKSSLLCVIQTAAASANHVRHHNLDTAVHPHTLLYQHPPSTSTPIPLPVRTTAPTPTPRKRGPQTRNDGLYAKHSRQDPQHIVSTLASAPHLPYALASSVTTPWAGGSCAWKWSNYIVGTSSVCY